MCVPMRLQVFKWFPGYRFQPDLLGLGAYNIMGCSTSGVLEVWRLATNPVSHTLIHALLTFQVVT